MRGSHHCVDGAQRAGPIYHARHPPAGHSTQETHASTGHGKTTTTSRSRPHHLCTGRHRHGRRSASLGRAVQVCAMHASEVHPASARDKEGHQVVLLRMMPCGLAAWPEGRAIAHRGVPLRIGACHCQARSTREAVSSSWHEGEARRQGSTRHTTTPADRPCAWEC